MTLSPEYCFVMEGENGICGYVCAALDAMDFQKKSIMAWIPSMREKYPKSLVDGPCEITPSEQVSLGSSVQHLENLENESGIL